jgi:hypothetical protein
VHEHVVIRVDKIDTGWRYRGRSWWGRQRRGRRREVGDVPEGRDSGLVVYSCTGLAILVVERRRPGQCERHGPACGGDARWAFAFAVFQEDR